MILMYRNISPEKKLNWWVSPDIFYEQMLDISTKKVVFLDDYNQADPNQIIIAFDAPSESIINYALPILEIFNYSFEVFVTGYSKYDNYHNNLPEASTNPASNEQLAKILFFGGRLQWHTGLAMGLSDIQTKNSFNQELHISNELKLLCPEGFNWFLYSLGETNQEYKSKNIKEFIGFLGNKKGKINDQYKFETLPVDNDTQLEFFGNNNKKQKNNKYESENIKVSVIIPVYNADAFVTQSVESALNQSETGEILLIEDGSNDKSLEVCKNLTEKYNNVHLFRHPNGKNRGAGASRNLGIQHAKYEIIAFLDADDFYLPDRFKVSKKVFLTFPDCDGVYEATGRFIENDEALNRWHKSKRPLIDLYTVHRHTSPENLSRLLLTDPSNCISPDGLVFRKRSIKKSGFMNEKLKLHQDVDFMIRLATSCKLYPGRIYEPASKWRMHERNRISVYRTEKQIYTQEGKKLWDSPYTWCKKNNYRLERKLLFYLMLYQFMSNNSINLVFLSKLPFRYQSLIKLFSWIIEYPKIIFESTYWKIILYQLINKKSLVRNSGFFKEDWYLQQNPDVAESKMDPLIHFLRFGGQEARDPGPCFSSNWYLYNYPGVWISGINPLVHYLRMGILEGRKPNDNH